MEETVTITKKEYDDLKDKAQWLRCLQRAGVDNWDGFDDALERLNAEIEKSS